MNTAKQLNNNVIPLRIKSMGSTSESYNASGKYAVFPMSILLDDRLSKIQLKVLIALFSFKSGRLDGDAEVYPKRSSIVDRCGYDEKTISTATTALQKLGWITKKRNAGGCSSPAYYVLHTTNNQLKNSLRFTNRS